MILKETCGDIFNQLNELLQQFNDEQYSLPVEVLSGNTIGKHMRHILEFYETMFNGIPGGLVDYDSRERNMLLENNVQYTANIIKALSLAVNKINEDKAILLGFSFGEETHTVKTYLYRELLYNIEHTIHHMAIIKIGVKAAFKEMLIPDNFGVAYSTLKHNKQCAQ